MDISSDLGLRALLPGEAAARATRTSLSTLPLLMLNLRYRSRTLQQAVPGGQPPCGNFLAGALRSAVLGRSRPRSQDASAAVAVRTVGTSGTRTSIVPTVTPARSAQARTACREASLASSAESAPNATL